MVVQSPHANASYGQMGICLRDRGVSNPFPCYLGKITEYSTSKHRGVGPKTAHSHCWAWIMVWPGGVGPAKLIKDSLDGAYYHGILARYVVPKVQ